MTNANLNLPSDHAELLAEAQATRPELTNFSQCSDCVKAQDYLGRFVHISHTRLRKRIDLRNRGTATSTKRDAAK